MRFIVRNDKRIAELWLTNGEQSCEGISEFISEKSAELGAKNYRLAVFRSGSRSLYDCTEGLLHSNF